MLKHWRILSYIFLTALFLLVSVALNVINTCSACLFEFRVGWINTGTYGAALTSCCSGQSGSSTLSSYSISDSTSAPQSSSLSLGFSKSPVQLSQPSVCGILSGVLSSSLSTGWLCILRIRWTFNIWVHPPGRSIADKGGGNGDLFDNLVAAAPLCWKSDHGALTISSVSKIHPTAVICLIWARDSFWLARMFRLPYHISKKLWTLAILSNFLSSASFFISESFSVFIVSNSGSALANIPVLARANCLKTMFSRRVSPVVFEWLQLITSQPREKLVSTPTPCGMIETMSGATIEPSAYLVCVSSCWCHGVGYARNQNVLLISIGSEW